MEFQWSYFKSWKMMLWKCLTHYASKFGNSAVATGLEKSVFIPIPKKGNAKECSSYHTITLISHASKVMLKIPQVRLQQYVNCGLPNVQAGFRKARGTRDQIAGIRWMIEKARDSRKTSTSALVTMPKPVCEQENVENSSRDGNTRPHYLPLEKSVCRSRTSLVAQMVKASVYNAGDPGSIPRLGRSPGICHGNPLQYSCLENPVDRGAWQPIVHGVAKESDRTEWPKQQQKQSPRPKIWS